MDLCAVLQRIVNWSVQMTVMLHYSCSINTDCRGRVGSILASYIGGLPFISRHRSRLLHWHFSLFPQSLNEMSMSVSKVRKRPFLFTSVALNYSLVILQFHSICSWHIHDPFFSSSSYSCAYFRIPLSDSLLFYILRYFGVSSANDSIWNIFPTSLFCWSGSLPPIQGGRNIIRVSRILCSSIN